MHSLGCMIRERCSGASAPPPGSWASHEYSAGEPGAGVGPTTTATGVGISASQENHRRLQDQVKTLSVGGTAVTH